MAAEEHVPKNCYYRMKWRQPITDEILQHNRKQIHNLGKTTKKPKYIHFFLLQNVSGLTNYTRLSIQPQSGLSKEIEAVFIVIVRWNDLESRQFMRNTIGPTNVFGLNYNIQLLFVFGIPSYALPEEIEEIEHENLMYQDMIVPGK